MPVSVHISEDSSALRTLMRRWLERDERVQVVGEAGDGESALRGLQETRPDVALLDLSMPNSRGPEMIAEIRRASPSTRVLIVTGSSLAVAQRMADQADGFLLKPASMPDLASAVCDVARRDERAEPGRTTPVGAAGQVDAQADAPPRLRLQRGDRREHGLGVVRSRPASSGTRRAPPAHPRSSRRRRVSRAAS